EREAGERGDREPEGHDPLRTLLRAGALHRPRVRVLDDLDPVELPAQFDEVVPAHPGELLLAGQLWLLVTHALAPIHRVMPSSAAIPTTNAIKPSDCGPRPPIASPPGLLFPFVTDWT